MLEPMESNGDKESKAVACIISCGMALEAPQCSGATTKGMRGCKRGELEAEAIRSNNTN